MQKRPAPSLVVPTDGTLYEIKLLSFLHFDGSHYPFQPVLNTQMIVLNIQCICGNHGWKASNMQSTMVVYLQVWPPLCEYG